MRIIELTEDNIADFKAFIGEDMAENIGRQFHRGLIATENSEIRGGIIWQYINLDKDCESNIEWFRALDRQASKYIFASYTQMIGKENARQSSITVPALESSEEKEFLKEAGFKIKITESNKIIVTLAELLEMPLMKDRRVPSHVKTVGEIMVRQFRGGINRCVDLGKRGLCEDMEYLPISAFEQDVSTCSLDENGEVDGLLLFHKLPSGILSIQLMIYMGKDVANGLPGMMRLFVNKMEEKYEPDTQIILNRHNEASLLLSEKLLPRGFGIPVYAGSRTEGGNDV